MTAAKIQAGNAIESVIRKAADRTGVDFGFLLKTARRESSLNPGAKAKTSSAAGLFQFVEQTWLGQLKRHGGKHGYGAYASMIEKGADGRLRCNSDEARRAVMNLRFDPSCSSLMAGELTSDHAAYLKGRIGREPTEGELYAAHFMGPAGAAKLIEAEARSPDASAAGLFPQAASANRSIFYRKGRPATVAEVYAGLTKTAPAAAPSAQDATNASGRAVTDPARGKGAPTYRVLGDDTSRRAYALETRLEQMRQEQSLVQRVLNDGGAARDGAFGAGLFSAEMLSVLAGAGEKDET
ncbi:MAG: Flagellar protein FlgJ [peptidoglycan hydrolase] [uncultured Sphingomonadaceae bacterium]|uniref:Flagellar protein FlgJ [peptidoglycan hydrolase] n=1 Tax=uncultured Sphingomonadaceae bacterium TaxID=169976 RepID=A0A6J4T052_9SPHN|nr:MAG: Flagellar protein FlgJ [peptidoglycan hydrolase] [uncultured Sphingomonadaceae bacterium]